MRVDFSETRARELSVVIPPSDYLEEGLEDTHEEPLECPCKCDWTAGEGEVRVREFQAKRDLMNHMRRIHKVHNLCSTATPTN
eukprot:4822933-Pyramimonas_sp.AAC.1